MSPGDSRVGELSPTTELWFPYLQKWATRRYPRRSHAGSQSKGRWEGAGQGCGLRSDPRGGGSGVEIAPESPPPPPPPRWKAGLLCPVLVSHWEEA